MEEQGLIDSEWLAAAVEGGNSRAARVFLRSLSALLFSPREGSRREGGHEGSSGARFLDGDRQVGCQP